MSKNRIRKTVIAGNLVWETISPCFNRWDSEAQRNAKKYLHKGGISSERDQHKNERRTKDKTAQLIAQNVKPDKWIFCSFTFSDKYIPKTEKAACRMIRYFLRDARAFEEQNRKQLRTKKLHYFWTAEPGDQTGRWHWHLLVNIPAWYKDSFLQLWKYGEVTSARKIKDEFGRGSNAYAITEYMIKNQYKKGQPAGHVAVKHSKGLEQPQILREYVSNNEHLKLPCGAQYAADGEYYSSIRTADGYEYRYERHCYIAPSGRR